MAVPVMGSALMTPQWFQVRQTLANSQLSKGIFLADILKRLLVAGLVDFGVKSVDKVGSESSVLLI